MGVWSWGMECGRSDELESVRRVWETVGGSVC